MTDSNNKQEFVDIILKALTKGKESNDNEFMLESIVMLSSEIQSLITAIDSMTNVMKYHNTAIEDLYTGQDLLIKMLNSSPIEEHDDLQIAVPKNKKDLN
jgi:hypothetical protein